MKKSYYYHSPQIEGEHRITVAGVELVDGTIRLGIAKCSLKDPFSKAKGREIALARAEDAKSGLIKPGKNKHKGIMFRKIAQGMVSSMMSNEYVFNSTPNKPTKSNNDLQIGYSEAAQRNGGAAIVMVDMAGNVVQDLTSAFTQVK